MAEFRIAPLTEMNDYRIEELATPDARGRPEFKITPLEMEGQDPGLDAPQGQGIGGRRGGTLARSVDRGLKQSRGLFGQLIREVGDTTGIPGLIDVGDDLIEDAFVEAVSNPARIHSIDDIDSASKAFEFLAQTVGEQLPNLALAITGGGIGAYLGKAAVGSRALAGISAAARQAAIRQGQIRGAQGGAFGAFFPINTGEILGEQLDAGQDPDLFSSALLGTASTSLDVLGLTIIGRSLFKGVSKPIAEASIKNVLARTGHATLSSLAAEGGTEAVQEAMVIASRRLSDPTFSVDDALTSSEGLGRIAFAGLSGAVVGGAFGGVGGVARAGIDSARMAVEKSNVRNAMDGFSSAIDAAVNEQREDGEVSGVMDFEQARENINHFITKVGAAVTGFFRTKANAEQGNGSVSQADVEAAAAAVQDTVDSVVEVLDMEREGLDFSEKAIFELQRRTAKATATLLLHARNIANKVSGVELSSEQNQAVHEAVKQIEEIRATAKKAGKKARMIIAKDMMKLAEKLVIKGITDPASVPGAKVQTMVREAAKYIREGLVERQQQLNKSREAVKGARRKVIKESRKVNNQSYRAPQQTEQQQGTTTPIAELLRSIRDFGKSGKPFIFAVGRRITDLPGAVKQALGKAGLIPHQEDGRIVFGKKKDIDALKRGEVNADDQFTTPLDEAVAASTVRDAEGKVVGNEGIAAEQAKDATEVRSPADAVVESQQELNEEAEQSAKVLVKESNDPISQVFRNITEFLDRHPERTVDDIPGNVLAFVDEDGTFYDWAEFQDMYQDAKWLAERFMDLSQFWDDETRFTQERGDNAAAVMRQTAEQIQALQSGAVDPEYVFAHLGSIREESNQFLLRAKNGHLMFAEETEGTVRREDGKDHKPFKDKNDALRYMNLKTFPKHIKKLLGITKEQAIEEGRIHVEKVHGEWVIRVQLDEGRVPVAEQQVRRIVARGRKAAIDGKENKYVLPAVVKHNDGTTTKAWIHLGEVTRLGQLLSPGEGSTASSARQNYVHFLTGLARLMTDYGFQIDFRPGEKQLVKNYKHKDGTVRDRLFPTKRARQHMNKIIFGQLTYQKSARTWLSSPTHALSEQIFGTEIYPNLEAELVESKLSTLELGDALLEASREGKDNFELDKDEVEMILFEQGQIYPDELRDQPDAEVDQEVGQQYIETPHEDVFSDDPTVPHYKPSTFAQREENNQVDNRLQHSEYEGVWKEAEAAVRFLIEKLGIKERIVLFDEDSAAGLAAEYRELEKQHQDKWAELALKTPEEKGPHTDREAMYHKRLGEMYNRAAFEVERAVRDNKKAQGRTINMFTPGVSRTDQFIPVFVSKVQHRSTWGTYEYTPTRGQVLMHELGHIVQHAYLERLSPALKAEILADIMSEGGTEHHRIETFANLMAKMAAEFAEDEVAAMKKYGGKDPYGGLFADILSTLKEIYDKFKEALGFKGKYPKGFASFVDALMTHQSVRHDGKRPSSRQLYTPLAKQIFNEFMQLTDLEAGYYPSAVEAQTVTQENMRAQDAKHILDAYKEGRQQFLDMVADKLRRKKEKEARRIPKEDWFKNAPRGKKLNLADPKVREILEQHQHWELLNDPEIVSFKVRSRYIARNLMHSALITHAEFLRAALHTDPTAEAKFMRGDMSFEEFRKVDLRQQLLSIIDKRVTRGDWMALQESIEDTLPAEMEWAQNDPKMMALAGWENGEYKPPSAKERAKALWKKPLAPAEIIWEAQARVYESMAEAYNAGEEMSDEAAELALAQEIGYLAEKNRVTIPKDMLIGAITQAVVLRNDMAAATNATQRSQESPFQNYFDNFQRFVQRLARDPLATAKMMVQSADQELRHMGEVGTWLANKFHSRPSSTDPSLNIPRKIRQRSAPFFAELHDLLKDIPGARVPLNELFRRNRQNTPAAQQRARMMEHLLKRTPIDQVEAELQDSVKEVRGYLNRFHGKLGGWGLSVRKLTNYYPLMLDAVKIENDRQAFEDTLVSHGFTQRQAAEIRKRMTRDGDGGLTNTWQEETTADFLGPGFANKNHRQRGLWTEALRYDLIDQGFYQDDLATTLIAYTDMAVRRSVWQQEFKETDFSSARKAEYRRAGLEEQMRLPVAKLLLRVKQANMRGDINNDQYARIMDDILPAYAGQLGFKTSAKVRRISSYMVIYQNLRLLSFAVFSSFVDVGTLMARTDANWEFNKQAFKVMLKRADRAEAMEMLKEIGALRQDLTEHILNDQVLNTFTSGKAKRINDLFFRYNGMEGWTNLMRGMALNAGRRFLQRHAQQAVGGANATSQRYLDELDITAQEILAWDGRSTSNERINAALNRFIDESMIRPDSPIRPVWMSDPAYGVFAHLKGFLWGFHETFLRRVGREAKIHQNYLPLITLGLMALPFAVLGYELRRKITGSKKAPEGFDYFQEIVERSGLPGIFQLIVDMEQANQYGKPFALGVTGPAVEQLYDFFTTDDFSEVMARGIPVVAQSPPLRQWAADTL